VARDSNEIRVIKMAKNTFLTNNLLQKSIGSITGNDRRQTHSCNRKLNTLSHMGFQLIPISTTLNDHNLLPWLFSVDHCIEVNEDRPILSVAKRQHHV